MGRASLHFDSWNLAWHDLGRKLAPRCGPQDCAHARSFWRRLRGQPRSVRMQGSTYCIDRCLERALTYALQRLHSAPKAAVAAHRVPLGLLLLSRQQLTVEQLRQALGAQRAAGRGRIGEWLQALGFASEPQITAALARQWSCPVLRAHSLSPEDGRIPKIPLALLQSFVMVPVDYAASTSTLLVAFGGGIDYTVLYALEQMLDCHTEPCLALPSVIGKNLQALAERRREHDVVFDRVADTAELVRIIRSYASRVVAAEVRLSSCGPHLWVRLLRSSSPAVDLFLRSPAEVPFPASVWLGPAPSGTV